MRNGHIGVAPEGLPFLFLLALTALAFAALRFWPLALVFLVLTWFSGHFFRDPERVVPSEDDIAVSPADGRVIRVEPKADPITGEVRPCISIFMNVFNVHVNRSPVAGRVEAIRYFPGKFFNAALDKASTDNERCAYLVRDDGGRSWVMAVSYTHLDVYKRQEHELHDAGDHMAGEDPASYEDHQRPHGGDEHPPEVRVPPPGEEREGEHHGYEMCIRDRYSAQACLLHR